MMTKVRIVALLMAAVALILVFLALQLFAPGDKLETDSGDAHIVFSADHGMLIAPGACVTVRWQVDHIQTVYFNELPTVGQGIEQVCTNTPTLPVLRVEFQDGTAQDYHLGVQFLVEQPSIWLLISAGVLLGVVSLYVALSRPAVAAPSPAGRRTPRIVLVFAALGMVISGIVVLAVVTELGLRFYFGQFGTQDEKTAYLRSRSEIDSLQSPLIVLPFVEYGLSPDFPGHNQLGYRGDEIELPKPAGVYRIVALGDSSTYGSYVPYDKTYPYDLEQVLRDQYGYKHVEVINAGVTNYTSWNMLTDLAFRISELQPDLVIVYAGWNDLDAREQSPDCYSAPSPFLGLDPRRDLRAQPADLSPSALVRLLATSFGWMQNPALVDKTVVESRISCSPQVVAEIPQNLQANPPVYFERNLREMIGVAQSLEIKLMFMSQAYNANIAYFPEFRRPAIIEHNAITARVAQENGALFFDYAAIAPTDKDSWIDVAHLTVSGNQAMAQDIAQYLIDQKVIPEAP
ncbi:MAG: GDSL-type esterase/lipase family protein [Chloroflexota bacterium]